MGKATLHSSAMQRLAAQLDGLDALFADASPEAIEKRPASGKWSARENLAHLARYHEVFLGRVERILSQEKPRFGRYRAEDDPEWPKWQGLSTGELQRRLKELRTRITSLISGLAPAELARTGIHPTFGEIPIPPWVEFFLAHEGHHLYTIFQRLHERA